MKYRVLLFDADGTLFDYDRAEEYALRKTLEYFQQFDEYERNIHLPLYREINQEVWDEFERGKISAEKLRSERFRRFFDRQGVETDITRVSSRYLQYLGEADFLLPGARDILAKVAGEYRLVLITNGLTDVQNSRLDRSSLRDYFEVVVISEEVGAPKPEPEIFAHTLQQIDYYNKEKVLIIGDSLSSDIKGGLNFGIDTCWFNPEDTSPSEDIEPDYIIKDINELLTVLDD